MKRPFNRKSLLFFLSLVLDLFIGLNLIACAHAYKFTHFTSAETDRTTSPEEISFGEKIWTAFTGVSNPRPTNEKFPHQPYTKLTLNDKYKTACWKIKAKNPRGTVVLFHGYGGSKSGLLKQADAFLHMNFNTVLVDFMGCGDTEGNITTIGYFEAEQVKNIYDYLRRKGETNIILYGPSMGAVAIMRAVSVWKIQPEKIILECPFSTLLTTVKNRFTMMGMPAFPMANLIVFWGGFQNEFNGFSHNPVTYAKKLNCSVLLLHGKEDPKVTLTEIEEIYQNFPVRKKLVLFENTAHENYLNKNRKEWQNAVATFLLEK